MYMSIKPIMLNRKKTTFRPRNYSIIELILDGF